MKLTLLKLSLIAVVVFALTSCECSKNDAHSIVSEVYGTTAQGESVDQYTLSNGAIEMKVITYGGRITSLKVPNAKGESENIVLGFDNLADYEGDNPFFGALIGRYGNRIAKGSFSLNDQVYNLATNDGSNHLHGGVKGYDRVVWTCKGVQTEEGPSLQLHYDSVDGEEGYPGNLSIDVEYLLTDENELVVSYKATTDQSTVVNLTQHAYFNLTADFSMDILGHEVVINADQYLPVDETLIPTGELAAVAGTPFDFTAPKAVGHEIAVEDEQLIRGKGYDHCWVLNHQDTGMRLNAKVIEPSSGRVMEVISDQPGIQFYTGNFLDGTLTNPQGGTYGHRTGFCLETQHYPDSPNQEQFPTTVLNPGETYQTKTVFKFSVVE